MYMISPTGQAPILVFNISFSQVNNFFPISFSFSEDLQYNLDLDAAKFLITGAADPISQTVNVPLHCN